MKKIQICGPGCTNCERLMENARAAAEELGIEYEIEKVSDIMEITRLGVLMTPGLLVDGEVKSSGKVLSAAQIKELLA